MPQEVVSTGNVIAITPAPKLRKKREDFRAAVDKDKLWRDEAR